MSDKIQVLRTPLVGMHFRPPAKAVLSCLPSGTPLMLIPDPENPYDAKAIKVLVDLAGVAAKDPGLAGRLDEALPGTGTNTEELLATGTAPLWLGFVADSEGKICRESGLPGNGDVLRVVGETDWTLVPARLGFGADGKLLVVVGREAAP